MTVDRGVWSWPCSSDRKTFERALSMVLRVANNRVRVLSVVAIIGLAVIVYWAGPPNKRAKSDTGVTTAASAALADAPSTTAPDPKSVDLADSQLAAVKVEPVAERGFPIEKEAVGSIDFN